MKLGSGVLACFAVVAGCLFATGAGAEEGLQALAASGKETHQLNRALFEGQSDKPYTLAYRAYVWGYPLVEAAKIRMAHTNPDDPFVKRPQPSAAAALNHLGHGRTLFGPEFRFGVGVNNDTIYSLGWFDMMGEPWVLEAPDFGDRYYTFSIYRSDSSSVDSVGHRTHGGQLPLVFIYAPTYQGEIPEGMLPLEVSTRYMNFAGRYLTTGTEEDYVRVHRLQDQVRMRPYSAYRAGTHAQRSAPEQIRLDENLDQHGPEFTFLARLGNILRYWIDQPGESAVVSSFAAIGLTREGFDPSLLDEEAKSEVLRAITDARRFVEEQSLNLGDTRNGWTINYGGSWFDDDYVLRAAVAKDQIYVTIPEEAVYPLARTDNHGEPLNACYRYQLSFAANDLPPVDGFWSVTLYNDAGYMVENPINRYSIGDRTQDLVYGSEGQVTVLLQHERPEGEHTANWLPTPEEGLFYLMMRLYIPQSEVLEQSWYPPAIEKLDAVQHCDD